MQTHTVETISAESIEGEATLTLHLKDAGFVRLRVQPAMMAQALESLGTAVSTAPLQGGPHLQSIHLERKGPYIAASCTSFEGIKALLLPMASVVEVWEQQKSAWIIGENIPDK